MRDDTDDSQFGEPCRPGATGIPDQRVLRVAAASRLYVAQLPQYKFTLLSPLEFLRCEQHVSPCHTHGYLV